MLFSSGWRFLSKTMIASLSKRTNFKRGTRYKMFDNMFKFQVVEIQVFNTDFTGVAGSDGALSAFQAHNSPDGRSFRHSWGGVRDCGIVPVNKC